MEVVWFLLWAGSTIKKSIAKVKPKIPLFSVFHFHTPALPKEQCVHICVCCIAAHVFSSVHVVRAMERDLFWLLSSIPGQRRHALHAPSYCERWCEEAKLGETAARRQCKETRDRESDLTGAAVEDLESEVYSPSAL